MSYDSWYWGTISAAASARGSRSFGRGLPWRQCFLLGGSTPVRTGRFRVAWLDAEGRALAWWTGEVATLTGGWEAERFLVVTDEDEAVHQLVLARGSFGDRRDRRVEIVEMV